MESRDLFALMSCNTEHSVIPILILDSASYQAEQKTSAIFISSLSKILSKDGCMYISMDFRLILLDLASQTVHEICPGSNPGGQQGDIKTCGVQNPSGMAKMRGALYFSSRSFVMKMPVEGTVHEYRSVCYSQP